MSGGRGVRAVVHTELSAKRFFPWLLRLGSWGRHEFRGQRTTVAEAVVPPSAKRAASLQANSSGSSGNCSSRSSYSKQLEASTIWQAGVRVVLYVSSEGQGCVR